MELAKNLSNSDTKAGADDVGHIHCLRNQSSDETANSISLLDDPGRNLLAKFVNQMVASAFEFPAERLLVSDRGNAKVTRARQISVYLMHTCLSFSLTDIGRIYSKDRTTIGHACRVIEDLRDEPAFDDRIIELEETIQTVLLLAGNKFVRGVEN